MPGQKRRYNVRFPPSRIKKIMQKDAEVGRIAMAVPVIICILPHLQRSARALEMFLKCLLTKTCLITQSKLSTVVSVAHMKQCIESEKLFDFLKDLAEQATSTASQKDNRGMSMWPLYRTRRHENPVKKPPEVVETAPRSSLDSLDNSSSSVRIRISISCHRETHPP
ncbi:Dr1-associated corepressor [Nibea albiflora]|uniref:Dr1-associated corepressor n=1 Tax=Nibea albiflora TaxID=240163 RepID=A0ACB7FJ23_NIBAL|nr:Dr1-associated corepressor [Nibea albiflora]